MYIKFKSPLKCFLYARGYLYLIMMFYCLQKSFVLPDNMGAYFLVGFIAIFLVFFLDLVQFSIRYRYYNLNCVWYNRRFTADKESCILMLKELSGVLDGSKTLNRLEIGIDEASGRSLLLICARIKYLHDRVFYNF